ncbi:MAG TPA: hypothetical protein VMA54_19990 [Steroidobacteraceae bacterium]|nr:hypothetical protein [Steroidobacteraceae bacterium]
MKLSTLLMLLALLLIATTRKWPFFKRDNRTIGQIYRDIKAGRQRSSLYARIVNPVALLLFIISIHLSLTWR